MLQVSERGGGSADHHSLPGVLPPGLPVTYSAPGRAKPIMEGLAEHSILIEDCLINFTKRQNKDMYYSIY
jgi:hypothetical protein